MTKNYRGTSFVLDDESYFPLLKTHIPGNDSYYSSDKSTTLPEVKYQVKPKFEKVVMLYIAISDRGISKPWFAVWPSINKCTRRSVLRKFFCRF